MGCIAMEKGESPLRSVAPDDSLAQNGLTRLLVAFEIGLIHRQAPALMSPARIALTLSVWSSGA